MLILAHRYITCLMCPAPVAEVTNLQAVQIHTVAKHNGTSLHHWRVHKLSTLIKVRTLTRTCRTCMLTLFAFWRCSHRCSQRCCTWTVVAPVVRTALAIIAALSGAKRFASMQLGCKRGDSCPCYGISKFKQISKRRKDSHRAPICRSPA